MDVTICQYCTELFDEATCIVLYSSHVTFIYDTNSFKSFIKQNSLNLSDNDQTVLIEDQH